MKFLNAPWAEEWIHQLLRQLHQRVNLIRFIRGEDAANGGAVIRLIVQPGRIVAKVQGSRAQPYDVLITAPTAKLPDDWQACGATAVDLLSQIDRMPELLPRLDEVRFVCTCRDWCDPCKHGVAAWLVAAQRWATYPEQFLFFRGIPFRTEPVPDAPQHAGAEERPGSRPVDRDGSGGWRPEDSVDPVRLAPVPSKHVAAEIKARDFWEGGLAGFIPPADEAADRAPAYVFVPPAAWPDWLEPYAKLMARVYAAIGEGTRTVDEDGPDEGWEEDWQAELAAYLMRRWAKGQDDEDG